MSQPVPGLLHIHYFGDDVSVPATNSWQVDLSQPVNRSAIIHFYKAIDNAGLEPLIDVLVRYKKSHGLNDWLFYQLIRRTAQQLSPKAMDYERYTLYKWFLLAKCGYDVQLAMSGNRLLMYVQSDDSIFDIPLFVHNNKQYVCLNIHDFDKFDLVSEGLVKVDVEVPGAIASFHYRISQIPDFKTNTYREKSLSFYYHNKENRYNIKLNPALDSAFNNYPSLDFESYFNIPMSSITYSSLIPLLKKRIRKMKTGKGVEYLMQFTRYAFPYEDDVAQFGKEKRLSPEQTLFYQYSDCDDRAALFFYLVKEIYDLPMIALMFPEHITIAVALKDPIGEPVLYNGKAYYICEPTPQPGNPPIGQWPDQLKHKAYKVVYAYQPAL